MSSPSIAKWRPPQSSWDIWHHIQMYWNTTPCIRLVYVLFRSVSFAWLCCDECAASLAVAVWSSSGVTEAAHKTSFEWYNYGLTARSWRRLRTLCEVRGTNISEILVEYLLIAWSFECKDEIFSCYWCIMIVAARLCHHTHFYCRLLINV